MNKKTYALELLEKKLDAKEPVLSDKMKNALNKTDELIELSLKKIELLKEFKAALIAEKSDKQYLTIYTDSTGTAHYLEHDKNFNNISSFNLDHLISKGKIRTIRTKINKAG